MINAFIDPNSALLNIRTVLLVAAGFDYAAVNIMCSIKLVVHIDIIDIAIQSAANWDTSVYVSCESEKLLTGHGVENELSSSGNVVLQMLCHM